MHFSEYQILAMRTRGIYNNTNEQLQAGCLGLAGESGEFIDLVKKKIYHQKLVKHEDLEKELGDVLWYIATIADSQGMNLDTVAGKNIEKLKIRYPEGFNYSRANDANRDLQGIKL